MELFLIERVDQLYQFSQETYGSEGPHKINIQIKYAIHILLYVYIWHNLLSPILLSEDISISKASTYCSPNKITFIC